MNLSGEGWSGEVHRDSAFIGLKAFVEEVRAIIKHFRPRQTDSIYHLSKQACSISLMEKRVQETVFLSVWKRKVVQL